jgi:hypothetical protein
MARTRWPSDLGTPASDPGQADQTGSAGSCQKNLGPADRSFRKTTRRRRQPNRRSGRDPGPRPYAHTTSKPGKPGRKHYPHPPCRICAMISSCFRGELDALNIPICACWESVRQLLGDDDDLAFGVPFAEIPQRLGHLAQPVPAVDDRRDLCRLAELNDRPHVLYA